MNIQLKELTYRIIPSPLGEILIAGNDGRIQCLAFQAGTSPVTPHSRWRESQSAFRDTEAQLAAYFAGELREFDLPLELAGTPFQLGVWDELRQIPYGTTVSYAELARAVGSPKAVRAVGAANGTNPIPIIIPCHRVVGSSGKLTGYRGGVDFKRKLLQLEMQ